MQSKKIWKWFWAWQDQEQENWLQQMSENGWHLASISNLGLAFNFDQGGQINFSYRLDYRIDKKVDLQEYTDFIEDSGWELVESYGGWLYFRKPVMAGETEELFTDNSSKIEKYKRSLTALIAVYPGFMIVFLANLDKYPAAFAALLVSVFVLLGAYTTISLIGLSSRIKKLNS